MEKTAKILIIDDDDDFRRMLMRLLKQTGYNVADAPNGLKGIEICRQESISLVITDIFMPEKEGIETVMELKAEMPALKIIAISGGGADLKHSYLKHMELAGVDATFEKPFNSDKLIHRIRELLVPV